MEKYKIVRHYFNTEDLVIIKDVDYNKCDCCVQPLKIEDRDQMYKNCCKSCASNFATWGCD